MRTFHVLMQDTLLASRSQAVAAAKEKAQKEEEGFAKRLQAVQKALRECVSFASQPILG